MDLDRILGICPKSSFFKKGFPSKISDFDGFGQNSPDLFKIINF